MTMSSFLCNVMLTKAHRIKTCGHLYNKLPQHCKLSITASSWRKLQGTQLLPKWKSKCYCTAVIPPPHIEGQEKEYSSKIKQIVDDISKLTLIEVADLNDLLKSTLKITDTPVMAMGGMPAAAAPVEEEDDVEPVQAKSLFTVKLTSFDASKKINLIKEIKGLVEGMNLVQAKKFVESLPQNVKSDLTKDEAEQLKTTLEAAGAVVEMD